MTANEVRKRLAQHYLAENGNYHAVRIDLPPGSYRPSSSGKRLIVEGPTAETQM